MQEKDNIGKRQQFLKSYRNKYLSEKCTKHKIKYNLEATF